MDRTRAELEDEVLKQWQALARAFKATAEPGWMELDLTLAQLRTLLVLAEEGPMVIGQIAHRLGIGLSTGGHLVDRLVQAGLAERAEDIGDRRRTMAQLTPKGEDLYMRLLNRTHHLQSLLQRMHEDELLVLSQGLQAIHRVVEEENRENYAAHTASDQKDIIEQLNM